MAELSRRARWRDAVWPAAALTIGIVSFEQSLHAARGFERLTLSHLLLDGALAFPLAFASVLFALRCAPARTLRRASVASGLFTIALVPAVSLHGVVHAHALPAAVAHVLHARGLEPSGWLAHGARDATAAFPVAIAIAMLVFRVRVSLRRARRFATASIAVATVLATLPAQSAPAITPFAVPLPIPPVLTSSDITLTAAQTDVQVLPGAPTKMWTFNGTFPGPTIRRPSGQTTHVTVVNDLPESAGSLTIHHHGEHAASTEDGQPASQLIAHGASRSYTYDLTEDGKPERGAFQWYHDHSMDVTGRNVWMGLAGMFILDDPADAAVNAALPSGDRDVPLMITDRTFDSANQIPYRFFSEGNQGNAILVNGAPQPYVEVADVKYRFRILNASNKRDYDFKLSDGHPMIQVGSESGLLPAPVLRNDILLGPAERAEVVVDFSGELGKTVTLDNLVGFTPNVGKAVQFRVVRHVDDASSIPPTLHADPVFDLTDNIVGTRAWVFGQAQVADATGAVPFTINGQTFDPKRVDAKPKLGTTERWVFVNTSATDHIVHIHDVDWHIVSRAGGPDPTSTAALFGGSGLRESFRLRANEVVTVISRFTDHLGIYVLHCHMLEHEDHSMMAQFEVVP